MRTRGVSQPAKEVNTVAIAAVLGHLACRGGEDVLMHQFATNFEFKKGYTAKAWMSLDASNHATIRTFCVLIVGLFLE